MDYGEKHSLVCARKCCAPYRVKQNITPWLYGACIEDVNHEIHGRLYDQKYSVKVLRNWCRGKIKDSTTYEGHWYITNNILNVSAHYGEKLAYDLKEVKHGSGLKPNFVLMWKVIMPEYCCLCRM